MGENTEFRMDEINIKVVISDLVKNVILIVMAALIAYMGVGTYKNIVYTPEYTASATLAVSVKGSADASLLSSLNTAREIADVYSSIFMEEVTMDRISEASGKEMPESAVISASVIPETNLMTLSVTADSPKDAYYTIQTVLDNYQAISDYIFGNAVIEVIMQPRVPMAPSNFLYTGRIRKLGMLAAAALMAVIIVICSVLRQTVKTPKAAKRHLEGECLTVFPHEEKNKTLKSRIRNIYKGVLLTNPVISFKFEESCHQLASRLDYKLKKNGQKTILVTSVAENEGKSTVAVNLAIALARRNKKVLIIDADFAKPALYKLMETKVTGNEDLINCLDGEESLDHAVRLDEKSGIYVAMTTKGVSNSQKYLRSEKFQLLLKVSRKVFDYIILDTSPVSAGTASELLSDFADTSLLVVRQDRVWISDVNDAIETLKGGNAGFLGYVLNDFDDTAGARKSYGYGYGNYSKKSIESRQ